MLTYKLPGLFFFFLQSENWVLDYLLAALVYCPIGQCLSSHASPGKDKRLRCVPARGHKSRITDSHKKWLTQFHCPVPDVERDRRKLETLTTSLQGSASPWVTLE